MLTGGPPDDLEPNHLGGPDDDEDDIPTLSSEALRALQEFRAEQQQSLTPTDSGSTVQENWQLSQFWYDDVTADVLAREALRAAGTSGGRIACVSCPTVYRRLKTIGSNSDVTLFEYDRRFQTFGDDFVFYDYRQPTSEMVCQYRAVFDVVLVDPPFLSDECLTKTAMTVRLIAKEQNHKVILCTGATMEDLAMKLLGLRRCTFRPGHARNLANEFRCYANYDLDSHVTN